MNIACRHRTTALPLAALACLPLVSALGDTNSFQLKLQMQTGDARLHWPSQPGELFHIERRTNLQPASVWQPIATNWPATGAETEFVHSNALSAVAGFYRVLRYAIPAFTFDWSGTNFTYTDSQRTFTVSPMPAWLRRDLP